MKKFDGAVPWCGLLDHLGDLEAVADLVADTDDPVFVGLVRCAFLDCYDVAAALFE